MGWGLESSALATDMSFSTPLRETMGLTLPLHIMLGGLCGLLAAAWVKLFAAVFTWSERCFSNNHAHSCLTLIYSD